MTDCDVSSETVCALCGGDLTWNGYVPAEYIIGGLPHVILHDLRETWCVRCGYYDDIGIPRIAQLHAVLRDYFTTRPMPLTVTEAVFLCKQQGLMVTGPVVDAVPGTLVHVTYGADGVWVIGS